MTDNVLYGAATDEQLKHRTLTVETEAVAERQGQFGQRFTGSTSSQLMKEPGDSREGAFTGKCCGVWLMLVLFFVVAIIAVAALVLSIIAMFRVYPVCDCSSETTCELVSLSPSILSPRILVSLSLSPSLSCSLSLLHSFILFLCLCFVITANLKLLFNSFIISCSVL